MFNIVGFKSPHEIKAGRIWIFIMNPSTIFESRSDIFVATLNYEYFSIWVDPILFLPLFHVSDVKIRRLLHSFVPLQEMVKSFWV